ncbi:hypothetical protein [Marinobacter salarius]|uniref:hypothetical protein n=1 Tax=Marinobacter salarius TaxID=1420917 RepID=UPI003BA8D305
MGVLYVAFVLVCGYVYTSLHLPARYRQKRASGWDSYFEVAKYGFYAVIGGIVFTAIFDAIDLPSITLAVIGQDVSTLSGKISQYSSGAITSFEISTALSALVLAGLFGVRERTEYKDPRRRLRKLTKVCKNDEMETILLQAALEISLFSVTLENRKCYIGLIYDAHVEENPVESIAIIPFYSGYRDSESLELEINRSYKKHYIEEGLYGTNPDYRKLLYFRIVIPIKQVVSCSLFSQEVYRSLSNNKAQEAHKSPTQG